MNDDHYIIATNLAKLRIASDIIRGVFPGTPYGILADDQAKILSMIQNATDILEKKVDKAT